MAKLTTPKVFSEPNSGYARDGLGSILMTAFLWFWTKMEMPIHGLLMDLTRLVGLFLLLKKLLLNFLAAIKPSEAVLELSP